MSEYLNKEFFEQDVKGFLFFIETTLLGTERAKIVFEFNKEALYKLREGDLVAVESFTSLTQDGGTYFTLLEITRVSPTHITIDRLKRYRFMGAVREFLKEATKDFEEGDPRLIRDHVYIEAEAVITGYLMKISSGSPEFIMEASKPILGRDVGVLKPKIVEYLINRGIAQGISAGKLYSTYEEKRKIDVKVDPHRMVTHHYTVFGFTGSGKSNLSATLLSKLVKEEKLNVIVFDLSDEYTALLADILENQGLVIVDKDDVPESLVEYYSGEVQNVDALASELAMKTKKPGVFDAVTLAVPYEKFFKKLIEEKRIKIIDTTRLEVGKLDFQMFYAILRDRCSHPANRRMLEQLDPFIIKALRDDTTIEKDESGNFEITPENLEKLRAIVLGCYSRLFGTREFAVLSIIKGLFEEYMLRLELAAGEEQRNENFVTQDWILKNYVVERHEDKKVCIIVSSDRERIANVVYNLISGSIITRRKAGTKTHDVLFMVDEAHEFVVNPRESGISDIERSCSRMIERLTRMGRKYGLGIGLSSQRVAYLNTTALSNCHTTFIGALPRKYDRDTMNEAYATSPDVLAQVVTFPPGNWYVVSMVAMGINNVPIRIVAPNREVELAKFFKDKKYLSQENLRLLRSVGYLPEMQKGIE